MESALSIKGHATILKAIRDHLHLVPGDRIKFLSTPEGCDSAPRSRRLR